MNCLRFLSFVLVSLSWGLRVGADDDAATRKAREVFARVAGALGIEEDVSQTAAESFEPTSAVLNAPLGKCLRLRTPSLTCEIESPTGRVVGVESVVSFKAALARTGPFCRLPPDQQNAVRPAHAQAEAFALGRRLVLATANLDIAGLRLRYQNFERGTRTWFFALERSLNGISFRDEGVGLTLDDVTGKLLTLKSTVTEATCVFPQPMPAAEAAKAAEGAARAIRQRDDAQGKIAWAVPSWQLQIVYRAVRGPVGTPAATPALAYLFTFPRSYKSGPNVGHPVSEVEVLIDAKTGEPLSVAIPNV